MAATLTTALAAVQNLQIVGRMNITPTPPSIDIYPGDQFGNTDGSGFGGISGEVIFTVRARVTTADHEAGQDLLVTFMDEEEDLSIAVALMADQTLNGKAASVYVEGPSGFTLYEDSGRGGALLGCDFKVTVLR